MTGYHPLTFRPFFRMKGHINRTGSALLLMLLLLLPAALHGQLYLNEVMASNATTHADLDFGEYADWIEIYNAGSTGIDLSGWYLSDDPGNPTMWGFQSGTTIPAGGYLLVYADGTGYGLHTNFKLSKEGETVLLVTPQVILGDSFTFPGQLTDISFGRKGGDLSVLGYFDSPTPGSANGSSQYSGIAAPPSCSLESGFFSGPVSVSMTSSTPGAAIRYTLDGTEPTGGSALYTAPVQISATAVLRATSFYSGMLTAPPVTHSYFINEPQNLPVVSLVTDPDHFFSDQTGIYVIGTNGVPGYCTEVPHNVNQDWERPVNIELIEKDGTVGLNQVAGVKIFGGCSRVRYPIKSLALFARKEYETSSFDYPLFPDKPNDKYESFVLRAGADDQPFTMIRDALTANVVKDVIDMDVQANRPVVVYINGEYWGIHSLREKVNEAYIRDNYGIDPDSLELLSNNPEDPLNVLAGSADHYNAMIQYNRDNDISQPSHYDYIRTQMEMDEYINYQIIQIFLGGRDWPGNNIKFWRSPYGSHNRWRWILFDLDHMFKEYFSDIMEEATEVDCGCVWPNPPWSTYLFRRLLENEAFSNEFKRRFALYSTTWFSRERLHGIIDEMEAELLPELPRHIERWGGQKTDLPDNTWVSPIFTSVKQWQQNVQVIRDFVDSRHEVALRNVNDYFGIDGYAGLELTVEPTGKGSVRSGDGLIPEIPYSGTFTLGTLLDLSCVATPGYLFSHWEVESFGTTDTSLITPGDTWNYLVTRGVPDSSWIRPEYDDSSWSIGQTELGYGDSDEQTVIDYGGDPDFKKLILDEPELNIRYTLHLLRDDGARIFVNGVEVVRDNLNRYYVGGYSLAEISQDAPDESTWFSYEINPGLFHAGENIIAVEVHQAAVTSSDLSFD
ncbi:MAG: CotH kinase family protein, partial [Bacteroidales bacterium]